MATLQSLKRNLLDLDKSEQIHLHLLIRESRMTPKARSATKKTATARKGVASVKKVEGILQGMSQAELDLVLKAMEV